MALTPSTIMGSGTKDNLFGRRFRVTLPSGVLSLHRATQEGFQAIKASGTLCVLCVDEGLCVRSLVCVCLCGLCV